MTAFLQETKEKQYRAYITDALQVIAENTARLANGGSTMRCRWVEIENSKKTETKTAEEIVSEVVNGAGLTIA